MVYPGRPSRGCDTCRRRKVKCDETHPTCERCAKAGITCEGYRDLSKIVFRSSNRRGSRGAGGERASSTASSSTDASGTFPDLSSIQTPSELVIFSTDTSAGLNPAGVRPSISPTLTSPWEDQALVFFFEQFIIQPEQHGNPGFFDFLPEFRLREEDGSPVQLALVATAYMNLANQSHLPSLITAARHAYGKALQATNEALKVPDLAMRDGTLCAILLLCVYGHICGEMKGTVGVHRSGFETLLKMRGSQQFQTRLGWKLFRHACGFMQLQAIGGSETQTENIQILINHLDATTPSAVAARTEYKISILCVEAEEILVNPNDEDVSQQLPDIIDRGISLDNELKEWNTDASPLWSYKSISDVFPHAQTAMEYSSRHVHVYRDLWMVSVWNTYRLARISLHDTIIRCAERLSITDWLRGPSFGEAHQQLINTSVETIQQMISDICSSIPFALSDVSSSGSLRLNAKRKAVGGYYAIQPLSKILRSPFITPEQAELAKSALKRVGYEMGIKQALIARGT